MISGLNKRKSFALLLATCFKVTLVLQIALPVEISDLNRKVSTWRVEEVQHKLKDYYFPYIQNDEGCGKSFTTMPVEIRVRSHCF